MSFLRKQESSLLVGPKFPAPGFGFAWSRPLDGQGRGGVLHSAKMLRQLYCGRRDTFHGGHRS